MLVQAPHGILVFGLGLLAERKSCNRPNGVELGFAVNEMIESG